MALTPSSTNILEALGSESRLLALPAELKNVIYRHVLLQAHTIEVALTGYPREGLLRTCKKIRSEALKIYYYENRFRVMTPHYKCAAMVKWHNVMRDLNLEMDVRTYRELKEAPDSTVVSHTMSCGHGYDKMPHWQNLLEMLRLTHDGTIAGRCHDTYDMYVRNTGKPAKVLRLSMHMLVRELSSQPWESVKRILDIQRPALGCCDPRWMIDHEAEEEQTPSQNEDAGLQNQNLNL